MIVIFVFSAQTGDTSSNMSGGISQFVISILYDDFDSFSPQKQLEIADTVHLVIRKLAHFTEYAILGVLSVLTVLTHKKAAKPWGITSLKSGLAALIFSALYAMSDEFHQHFVSDREPNIIDVLIDSSGALTGIIFASLMFYLIYARKHKA